MNIAVLFVDDDQNFLHSIARTYRHQPFALFTATSAEEAMFVIKSRTIDVIVADEQMPGMCGGELLAWVADHCPEVMRIVLTGQPTVESTIRAINMGRVFHFFTKPCRPADLAVAIHRAAEYKSTLLGNLQLEHK
jgi:DNA-binding NtrC family response regulator